MSKFKYFSVLVIILLFSSSLDAKKKECGIVAHRGFWNCEEAGYAKNSIAALKCAQEAGFWGSEFDVNMTSDGVLIVYHDSDVEGKKIEKHPYTEFKDYRIKNGETIPTLDEYLEQGKKFPETMLVFELKPHSCKEIEDRFVELSIEKLKDQGILSPDRVMFISFSIHICEILANKLPDFTVQFLGAGMSPEQLAKKGINGVDYHHAVYFTNKRWYKQARKNNMSVNAWTVNNAKEIKRMLRLGVDYITTDEPLLVREIINQQ